MYIYDIETFLTKQNDYHKMYLFFQKQPSGLKLNVPFIPRLAPSVVFVHKAKELWHYIALCVLYLSTVVENG